MNIDWEGLSLSLQELKCSIDESKNLVFNGKVVQADRKIHGCQVRCNNILQYVLTVARESNGNVANEDNKEGEG